MSTSLPPTAIRQALERAGVNANAWPDSRVRLVGEALEEQGWLIVSRSDVHALRAAADRVIRYVPATRWPHTFRGDVGSECTEPGCGQMASNGAAH